MSIFHKRVITFGTFDIFHYGHLMILKRAKTFGDYLIVGVSSDELNFIKKKKYPFYSQKERIEIVSSIKYVDEVFIEESLELKSYYIQHYNADILIMGDDWKGKFDDMKKYCDVIYLPRTPTISTSALIETIRNKS